MKKKKKPSEHFVIQKREEYESFATGATDRFRDSWQIKRSINNRHENGPRMKDLLDKEPGE